MLPLCATVGWLPSVANKAATYPDTDCGMFIRKPTEKKQLIPCTLDEAASVNWE